MFFNHNKIKLDINQLETGKSSCVQKLNFTRLENLGVKKEIKREMREHFELNENKNIKIMRCS